MGWSKRATKNAEGYHQDYESIDLDKHEEFIRTTDNASYTKLEEEELCKYCGLSLDIHCGNGMCLPGTEEFGEEEDLLNKIYNMDCLEGLKQLDDNSIDLLLTDPPYEMGGGNFQTGSIAKKITQEYREKIEKINTFEPLPFLEAVKPKLKKMNAYIWTSKKILPLYIEWAIKNKYSWEILIYSKNNPMPIYNNTYLSDKEYCLYIRETGATFNNGLGYREYFTVYKDNLNNTGLGHPTIKHSWMIKKQLLISSKENDIVLDCFMGSGTTAVVCKENNRKFIGFEISEEYCEIAKQRLKKVNNKKLNQYILTSYNKDYTNKEKNE